MRDAGIISSANKIIDRETYDLEKQIEAEKIKEKIKNLRENNYSILKEQKLKMQKMAGIITEAQYEKEIENNPSNNIIK